MFELSLPEGSICTSSTKSFQDVKEIWTKGKILDKQDPDNLGVTSFGGAAVWWLMHQTFS